MTTQLWARHNKKLVSAHELAQSACFNTVKKRTFSCLTCTQPHKMSLVKTDHKSYTFAGHFRHPRSPHDRAASAAGHTGSGESAEHLLAKSLLQNRVGEYCFLLAKCPSCPDHHRWEYGQDACVELERSVRVDGRRYVYDAVMKRGDETIVMEVWHKHQTGAVKICDALSGGSRFAEFCSDDVARLQLTAPQVPCEKTDCLVLENLKTEIATCLSCAEREAAAAAEMAARAERAAAAAAEMAARAERAAAEERAAREDAERRSRQFEEVTLVGMARPTFFSELRPRTIAEWRDIGQEKANTYAIRVKIQNAYCQGMKKCAECKIWNHIQDTFFVARRKFTAAQYARLQSWYIENNARIPENVTFCDKCVMPCPRCHETFRVKDGCLYGVCYDCHRHFKSLKRMPGEWYL